MQQVNFDAIFKNALYFRNILGKSRLCAVLKNNAYGHGLERTAMCLRGVADYFAVGSVSEALQIGFPHNVLVLLPPFGGDIALAVQNNFVLTVDSVETMQRISKNVPFGKRARVHIKIESGMNRLGFEPDEMQKLIVELPKNLQVEGAFSHFWGDDETSCNKQLEEFLQAVDILEKRFDNLILHIANTSAVLLNSKYHLDMARVGLGLYGYGSSGLAVAKTVSAQVIATRHVHSGETVGYGASHTFLKDTNIAVLNVGYAHGFPRVLKNSVVKIGDKLCPIVGNLCMAMLMVDVGELSVNVGDNAILLGEGVNNANNDVIVYELLCNLR